MVSHIHWPNRDNWIWLNILETVFKCDIIMMIFFNLQNWNIHSEGQYIIVCFIDFNVSNGHQHHATIDTSCTPPLCSQAAEHFLVKLEDVISSWWFFLIYRTGTFTVKGNTLLFVSSTSMSVMGISIMQPLTQAAPPPPLCSQAAEHFLVKLEDENFPWPSNIHYKPKSFMQKNLCPSFLQI